MNLDLRKLKIAQANACLSVNELVEKTGLGRATVSKILNGATPSIKSAGLLAKALNVDVTELLTNEN
ncbi:helix-turn-helix transcriptional regulator [Clostridium botulinum]|uniref:helix-turn-helix transcriptional regulator n=1 Tax=Clostridium sp. ZS1 TaxID=2949989 RepID=UPI001450A73F|nr:helix-turn-helix transcriptional regulator [Clostridium sp. ZS1]NFO05302.1 helix-turn-helix transcriptional regulator [Clostridium botulinum]